MAPSCERCRFFSALTTECRKNPPSALSIPTGKPGEFRNFAVFPPVSKDTWCGAFERQPDANDSDERTTS